MHKNELSNFKLLNTDLMNESIQNQTLMLHKVV